MNKPLVSVMIITYNQREFLRENIESILVQDYGIENIEIVIADDASTDGTKEMLLDYKSNYPDNFILKISKENQGITKNSNLGLFPCTGKYIFIMGGDDLMYQYKISSQVKFLEENSDKVACYHDLDVFRCDGSQKVILSKKLNMAIPMSGKKNVVAMHGCFMGATSLAFKRDSIPIGGYNEMLPFASDFLFTYQLLENGGEIGYINKILGGYRRHANNITSRKNKSQIIKNTVDHLNSNNIILSNDQSLGKEYLHKTGADLTTLRNVKGIYLRILLMSFIARPRLKVLGVILINIISLGKIKL